MPATHDVTSLFSDARLQGTLKAATTIASGPLTVPDFFVAALVSGDTAIWQIVSESLTTGHTETDLKAALPQDIAPREFQEEIDFSLTEELAKTIDDFTQAAECLGNEIEAAGLELLLSTVVSNLSDEDRRRWSILDWSKIETKLKSRVAAVATVQAVGKFLRDGWRRVFGKEGAPSNGHKPSTPSAGAELQFPDQAGPWTDLTARMLNANGSSPTPFEEDPAYAELFESIARILHRGHRHHILLVAERGMGQSMILAEFARQAAVGKFPFLKNRRFLHFDARFTPRDQSRLRLESILGPAANVPGLVVYLEGFAALLRGEHGASHLLPLLSLAAAAKCRIVAVVEPWEYEELLNSDTDLSEMFEHLDVFEPELPSAVRIVRKLADGLSERYKIAIEDDTVRAAVFLSSNYILNERQPGKALRVLHRVCERVEFDRTQKNIAHPSLTIDQVIHEVSGISGVPGETLRGIAERTDYEQSLAAEIFGQDHAVSEVATELGLIKAGLTDPGKPASVMLFVGQTGTGKTELAKVLAQFYSTSKRLKTYTLGNFVESHSVAGIIGVPAGYVGHDQGGRLINDLVSDPYCVFLLDEADKAHPDVLQPFLNLFDEGWIRDQRGVQARAEKAIFILTTNVGQRMIAEMSQQGKSIEEIAGRMKEALGQIRHGKSNRPVFTAEFLARLKRVVIFRPLDRSAFGQITRRLIADATHSWNERRHKDFKVTEELLEQIAEKAHQLNEKSQGREGGRIVRKLISDWIDAPVQRAISQDPHKYSNSSHVIVQSESQEERDPLSDQATVQIPKVLVRFECIDQTGLT